LLSVCCDFFNTMSKIYHYIYNMNSFDLSSFVYDPIVGRMLNADPGIYPAKQSESGIANATSGQDFNRYSYVRNNPLRYTDPSGYLGAVVCSGCKPVVISHLICSAENSYIEFRRQQSSQ
jgi:RHS repeat-associated protein